MTTNTIVKNIIKSAVEKFINKHLEENKHYYMFDSETKLELLKSERKDDIISFDIEMTVNWLSYKIHGYINEFGNVNVTMVTYNVYDKDGKNKRTKYIYDEELKVFKFN